MDEYSQNRKSYQDAAAEALGKIGDASVVAALCEVLRDTDAVVREAVARALGNIGDASAMPALRELLNDHLSYANYTNNIPYMNPIAYRVEVHYAANEAIRKIEKRS